MAVPECHMRRRTRLAGLQRPRAASVAHPGIEVAVASFATGRPLTDCATGLRCTPLVVLSINSEMECPDLFRRIRVCLLKITQCCARASPKSTLPPSHFHAQLKTACTLTHSVGVSAMAVIVGCDTRLGKRRRSGGAGMGSPRHPASP